jgi:hypothetical protein
MRLRFFRLLVVLVARARTTFEIFCGEFLRHNCHLSSRRRWRLDDPPA